MPQLAIGIGILLTLIGLAGYFVTGASLTALAPALLGVLLVALGALALEKARRKHAMHAASLLALLGLVGSSRRLPELPDRLAGGLEGNAVVLAEAATAVLLLVFLVFAVKSFVDARRRRNQTT